jgi:hypothetical protein
MARCTLIARPISRTTLAKVIAARGGLATPMENEDRARYRLCRATYPRTGTSGRVPLNHGRPHFNSQSATPPPRGPVALTNWGTD